MAINVIENPRYYGLKLVANRPKAAEVGYLLIVIVVVRVIESPSYLGQRLVANKPKVEVGYPPIVIAIARNPSYLGQRLVANGPKVANIEYLSIVIAAARAIEDPNQLG